MAFSPLLQLRILRLGFLQDGNIGVGVVPEGEEILVGRAGGGDVSLEDASACQAEMGEGRCRRVSRHCSVIEEVLEFPRSLGAVPGLQIGYASDINGAHGPGSA